MRMLPLTRAKKSNEGSCSMVEYTPKEQIKNNESELNYLCSACKTRRVRSLGRPLRMFFYNELKVATNMFSYDNYLARTKTGHVFKGVLESGDVVAVKILTHDVEIKCLRSLLDVKNSSNVVGLVGYCDEERGKRFLVLDFICNGSLEWHLALSNENVLSWKIRKSIAIGIGRGLQDLHTSCSIEHRDLRSSNILLTHDYMPMITGLCFARLKSQPACLDPPFTTGYSAPEHYDGQEVNEKNDIFAYGVILLELITARKAFDESAQDPKEMLLTEWAFLMLKDFDFEKLVDPKLDHYNHHELLSMMTAASLCLRKDPVERPTISRILAMLEDDGALTPSQAEGRSMCSDSTASVFIQEKKVRFNLPQEKTTIHNARNRRFGLSYDEML